MKHYLLDTNTTKDKEQSLKKGTLCSTLLKSIMRLKLKYIIVPNKKNRKYKWNMRCTFNDDKDDI